MLTALSPHLCSLAWTTLHPLEFMLQMGVEKEQREGNPRDKHGAKALPPLLGIEHVFLRLSLKRGSTLKSIELVLCTRHLIAQQPQEGRGK